MNPLAGIAQALEAVAAAGGDRAPGSLSPAQLVAVNNAMGQLKRHVDAAMVPVAAEIARQSRAELGGDSLAKKQGFRTPATMISTTTGTNVGDAIRLVQVGEATAPRMALSGEALPPKRPHVAAAVESGVLGVFASSQIVSLLERVSLRADAAALDAMEAQLVAQAPGLRPDQLAKLIARAEAYLDPDGVEPRERQGRDERALTIHERDGRFRFAGDFDIETGAPIKAAIEGLVTGMLRRNEHAENDERDERSVRQMQADALADLCRHALGCDQTPTLPTATIVVRMDLECLTDGVGTATIDGIDQPVSAAAVRRLAVDAQVIPCVLGGDGEILDWGRAKRLFTPAQKLALAERDVDARSARRPSRGASRITSGGGIGMPDPPISKTACSSARAVIIAYTMTAGRYGSREVEPERECGSSHLPGSTHRGHPASAGGLGTTSSRERRGQRR